MSADALRQRAKSIREMARPLREQAVELSDKLKLANGDDDEPLRRKLRYLTNQIDQLAREANNCDLMASGRYEDLR